MPMDNRKGILLLTDSFVGMGGSERNITQLIAGIDKNKFDLYVACFASGNLAEIVRKEGFSIIDLHGAGIYTISGLRNLAFLKGLVNEKKISLVVTYHEGSDFYGLVLSRICNIPVISARRDMGFKTKLHHRLAYRLVGRYFDSAVAVSNAVKQEVIKRRWFPEKRISTIYNAINVSEYGNTNDGKGLKMRIGINPKHPVVGLVANMRKIKGHQYFIQAASKVHEHNRDVEFLIIGYDLKQSGYTIAELELLAEKLGISQNVHFLRGKRDMPDLISIFDVAVVSSLSEGFSNAILEYMASSKPVVATRVEGTRR